MKTRNNIKIYAKNKIKYQQIEVIIFIEELKNTVWLSAFYFWMIELYTKLKKKLETI